MIRTLDILEMLKARYGVVSNRQLAKNMGVSHGLIHSYFKGESLSIDRALDYADELELDIYQVLIGNLCEKRLITQRAKEILAATIGEDIRLKPDRITALLATNNNQATTQTSTLLDS
jgi:AcrR family transcriptional regulator